MANRLKALQELIVEAATLYMAVDDFEKELAGLNGEQNAVILATVQAELCRAEIELINFVLANGAFLRLLLVTEETNHLIDSGNRSSVLADLSKDQIRKILFG